MTGLEKVTQKIITEAEDEAEKLLSAAEAKKQAIIDSCNVKIAKMRAESEAQAIADGESLVYRAKASSDMQNRNIILEAKCKALDETFNAAENEICSFPDGQYFDFVIRHASAAIDASSAGTECLITLNEKDQKRSAAFLEAFNKAFPGRKFTLSGKTAQISGGVLLDFGDTDVDCSVAAVLAEHRPELEGPLCRLLFETAQTK